MRFKNLYNKINNNNNIACIDSNLMRKKLDHIYRDDTPLYIKSKNIIYMDVSFSKGKVETIFKAIKTQHCPICQSLLHVDDQEDSVYVSCGSDYSHFELSGFKDLSTGKLALIYLNKDNQGIIQQSLLKKFQKILFRKAFLANNLKKNQKN